MRKKMIDVGDEIVFKATCINISNEEYLFSLSDIPYEKPFNIILSSTDKINNQRINEALDKLKITQQG